MRTEERKEPRTDVNQYTSHFFKAGGGGGGYKEVSFLDHTDPSTSSSNAG